MRSGFVHEAALELGSGADEGAPGAAVTVQLCGHWEHEDACRWPHHTAVDHQSGSSIRVRTVFACDPDEEQAVRQRIAEALAAGRLDTESGTGRWTVVSQGRDELSPEEAALALRLAQPRA
jgi:hypothetical protein